MLTFFATAAHFVDHLAPIWHAIPPDERGGSVFMVPDALETYAQERGIEPTLLATRYAQGDHIIVASYLDLTLSRGIQTALVEHGAGQTYNGADHPQFHGGYAGGKNRERVELFLCPNQHVADLNRAAYPDARTVVVGCPKLDALVGRRYERHDPPVIAVAWHWNCGLVPETGTAWPHWQHAVSELAQSRTVVGSGHPRARGELEAVYRSLNIDTEWDFDKLLHRADVLVADNSSVIYEWAAIGKPVLVANSPAYRKNVNHGLRFWDLIPGRQLDRPAELAEAVTAALEADVWAARRREISEQVYTHLDGTASRRAADTIQAWAYP